MLLVDSLCVLSAFQMDYPNAAFQMDDPAVVGVGVYPGSDGEDIANPVGFYENGGAVSHLDLPDKEGFA